MNRDPQTKHEMPGDSLAQGISSVAKDGYANPWLKGPGKWCIWSRRGKTLELCTLLMMDENLNLRSPHPLHTDSMLIQHAKSFKGMNPVGKEKSAVPITTIYISHVCLWKSIVKQQQSSYPQHQVLPLNDQTCHWDARDTTTGGEGLATDGVCLEALHPN